MMEQFPGNLFVVAAPSGAGKSSLVKALMELDAKVQPSVSHTTRPPRGQEKHGREYYFVSDDEFARMVEQQAFLEWAAVHGHRYGTSRMAIESRIAQGADVVLEIDYQGAAQIKQLYPDAVLMSYPRSASDVMRDHKWLGSSRHGILNLGGADPQDLERRCEVASHLLGWTPPQCRTASIPQAVMG